MTLQSGGNQTPQLKRGNWLSKSHTKFHSSTFFEAQRNKTFTTHTRCRFISREEKMLNSWLLKLLETLNLSKGTPQIFATQRTRHFATYVHLCCIIYPASRLLRRNGHKSSLQTVLQVAGMPGFDHFQAGIRAPSASVLHYKPPNTRSKIARQKVVPNNF